MKLKCDTLLGTTSINKSKVYFACHENDFKYYYKTICNDIFKYNDCAIYYYENKDDFKLDDHYATLNEMNLVVAIITSNFLRKNNDVYELDFQYAYKHHIPILPIMVESSLESLFDEKCYSLQFLDKFQNDPTAIPYEEKLEKFLNTVLLNDKTYQLIHNEFRGQIFLSYRKKDRIQAQKLMKKIHEHKALEDVSIWYDEFLDIGENFNRNIDEAITLSEILALAITPHVLEKDNYVMKYEYPEAKKRNKIILPVEMIETNRERLTKCFDGISEPVTEDEICKQIIYVYGNDINDDLKHRYYIGLAYLMGVGVEKNYNKAISIIESVANQNYLDAMRKMADIYINGTGVKINYDKAIYWQEQIVELLSKDEEILTVEEKAIDYCISLSDLMNTYEIIDKNDKALEKLLIFRDFVENKVHDCLGSIMFWLNNMFSGDTGYVYTKQNALKDILNFFKHSISINRKIDLTLNLLLIRKVLSTSFKKIGKVYLERNQLNLALDSYYQSYYYDKLIEAEEPTIERKKILSIDCKTIGQIYIKLNQLEKALNYYQKASFLYKQIDENESSIESKKDLVEIYVLIKCVCEKLNRLCEALEYKEKIIELH